MGLWEETKLNLHSYLITQTMCDFEKVTQRPKHHFPSPFQWSGQLSPLPRGGKDDMGNVWHVGAAPCTGVAAGGMWFCWAPQFS